MHCSIGSWLGFADSAGQRKVDAVFAGRAPLSDDEFFERFFATSEVQKQVAVDVRRAVLENLMFDMRCLAPEDSFAQELQFVWKYDSLADVELLCQVENQFSVTLTEAEAKETVTLGALIRLVDHKVKAKKNA
jgi:acyl carrier protein